MKKFVLIVLLGIMLVSMPYTTVAQEKTLLDNTKIYTNLKNNLESKFIEEFGEEALIEFKNSIVISITSSIFNSVEWSYNNKGEIDQYIIKADNTKLQDTLDYWNTLDSLIAICQIIGEFFLLLFGHSDIGYFLGMFICYMVMFIPARLISIPAILEDYTAEDFRDIILYCLEKLNLNMGVIGEILNQIDEIIWEYGLIGGVIVLLIASPVLIVLLPIILLVVCCLPVIILPLIRTVYTFDILNYIVLNAYGIFDQ